tara:strand:+ start:401 stop:997 length:597 start_codon:yes stop_codon:yes gene_type:complete
MKLKHSYAPWEHIEIEDYLPSHRFQEIQDLAQIELEKFHKVGTNTRRGKYVNFLSEDLIPETSGLFLLLPRRESSGQLKKLMHWSIIPPHVDYPTHIDNSSRLCTVTYYISPDKNIGTIICSNPSTNDNGDHNAPNLPTQKEYEIEWKPNKVFLHCGGSGKWHRYSSGDEIRINLSIFLVQPDLIRDGRPDHDFLIDL